MPACRTAAPPNAGVRATADAGQVLGGRTHHAARQGSCGTASHGEAGAQGGTLVRSRRAGSRRASPCHGGDVRGIRRPAPDTGRHRQRRQGRAAEAVRLLDWLEAGDRPGQRMLGGLHRRCRRRLRAHLRHGVTARPEGADARQSAGQEAARRTYPHSGRRPMLSAGDARGIRGASGAPLRHRAAAARQAFAGRPSARQRQAGGAPPVRGARQPRLV